MPERLRVWRRRRENRAEGRLLELPAPVRCARCRYEVYDRTDTWEETVMDGGACGGLKATANEIMLIDEGLFDHGGDA